MAYAFGSMPGSGLASVRGADVAQVLKSGRRLLLESGDGKIKRDNDGDKWLKVVNTTRKVYQNGWPRGALKTKQVEEEEEATGDTQDKMFGLQFFRRQRRKMGDSEEGETTARSSNTRAQLSIVVNLSCGESRWLSAFLFLVLNYVKIVGLRLKDLSAFVLSEPIHGAYSSRGILFLKGSPSSNVGVFPFYGITGSMLLFSVDFSAAPLCFKYLHCGMLLRCRSFFLVNNLTYVDSDDEMIDSLELERDHKSKQKISCYSSERGPSKNGAVAHAVFETNDSPSLSISVRFPC
ncbi:hypothetical protein L6164_021753 [Bauhinia variegata]|uniref:Uncharacterized protein n=1 Tax=Bauhinia variegata TaxID=167791 RepID=A0ACB9MGB2_BAUVA|nr:hypothetical protein L6164_021753 [Bauhinia variegata]